MEYRWHIFLANLDPVIGSEQGKTRPVLVISEEEINGFFR
jgi:mRNA interferase MazF